jgi:hypothetical protein
MIEQGVTATSGFEALNVTIDRIAILQIVFKLYVKKKSLKNNIKPITASYIYVVDISDS